MAVDDSDPQTTGETFTQQLLFGISALLGIGVVYALGRDAYLNQVVPWELTAGQLYSMAFVLGVWATITVVFLINYLSTRLVDEPSVQFKPPEE